MATFDLGVLALDVRSSTFIVDSMEPRTSSNLHQENKYVRAICWYVGNGREAERRVRRV